MPATRAEAADLTELPRNLFFIATSATAFTRLSPTHVLDLTSHLPVRSCPLGGDIALGGQRALYASNGKGQIAAITMR